MIKPPLQTSGVYALFIFVGTLSDLFQVWRGRIDFFVVAKLTRLPEMWSVMLGGSIDGVIGPKPPPLGKGENNRRGRLASCNRWRPRHRGRRCHRLRTVTSAMSIAVHSDVWGGYR